MDKLMELLRKEGRTLQRRLMGIEAAMRALEGTTGIQSNGKRHINAAARKKMSLAGKKRWAAIRGKVKSGR